MSAAATDDAPPSPRVGFVIGGVQKAGTSALASYLAAHPRIRLPRDKEAHVFDAPDFDEQADAAAIDARYAGRFEPHAPGCLYGDATPIYALRPRFIERIKAYNPAMRWIIVLRHPVARAISNYHMERDWGRERWPLWLALLLEPLRMAGRYDDFSMESPLRHFSYRYRGDYAAQLDALYRHFARPQVLVLRNQELAADPAGVYRRVCAFLGLELPERMPAFAPVFVGNYPAIPPGSRRWRLLCWWMRRELRAQRERYGIDWEDAP